MHDCACSYTVQSIATGDYTKAEKYFMHINNLSCAQSLARHSCTQKLAVWISDFSQPMIHTLSAKYLNDDQNKEPVFDS